MFALFSELQQIAKQGRKAVCSYTALGGYEIEAYRDDDRAFIEVQNGSDVRQAEITIVQFKALSAACDWDVCGAQSADDAEIMEAAVRWLDTVSDGLTWQKRGRGKAKNSLVQTEAI